MPNKRLIASLDEPVRLAEAISRRNPDNGPIVALLKGMRLFVELPDNARDARATVAREMADAAGALLCATAGTGGAP